MPTNDTLLRLRQETKASFGLCKQAAEKFPDDYEKAKAFIIELIKENSGKREGRVTQNGVIDGYINTSGSLASLVEVLCETDFVAKNTELKEFAHMVALQVVAVGAMFVSEESIPADFFAEKEVEWRKELLEEGKPEKSIPMIIEGKKKKYLSEVILLDQEYFKDHTKTIRDLLKEVTGKLGENIKISRIERWQI